MADRLGWRCKLGVLIPAPNTSVQPEMDRMRPRGVTNHIERIDVRNSPLTTDKEFEDNILSVQGDLMQAVDRLMQCQPAHLIMGMSAPTFWNGLAGSLKLKAEMEARAGIKVSMGSESCAAALRCYPAVKRIAILTPYQPVGDAQVRRYFTDAGYEVLAITGLKRPSNVEIAHANEDLLVASFKALAATGADAIVQVGTDLAAIDLADEAERWLDLPVIAVNAATYWHGMRSAGLGDTLPGHTRLLRDF